MAKTTQTTKTLTIGQVAKQAEIGVETVRFYERKGLILEPGRRSSGYRQYDRQVVDRLRFIRRAKDLGFTLREIKDLLELQVDPQTSCLDVKQRAESKIADIGQKIETLTAMKTALETLVASCRSAGSASQCSILEAFNASPPEAGGTNFCEENC